MIDSSLRLLRGPRVSSLPKMKTVIIRKLIVILLFVICTPLSIPAGYAHADQRYVSDTLLLTLREGPGNGYKVIRTLRTGDPLEVLEEMEQHLKVRTEQGEEGWVAEQYITSETPKPLIIAGLEKENEQLRVRVEELEKKQTLLLNQLEEARLSYDAKVKELENDAENYRQEVARTTMELEQITEKHNALLEQSKNVVELAGEHDKFKTQNAEMVAEINRLNEENSHLKTTRAIRWFLAGAGVLLIGLIAGRVTRKKKYF
jgi:SH3 domain protein